MLRAAIKTNLESALGVGLGITLGGVIVPHYAAPPLFFVASPPLVPQALLYFAVTCCGSFLLFCLSDWMKSRFGKWYPKK